MKLALSCRTIAAIVLALTTLIAGCGNVYSRDDFTAAINGKTAEEIEKQYGSPDSVDDDAPAKPIWTYKHKTFDLSNQNKVDSRTRIFFERQGDGGKLFVNHVEFANG